MRRHGSLDPGQFLFVNFQVGTSQILWVRHWPKCSPWSIWVTHDSTNSVNWAKDSITVTLVYDMEIVFGALVSWKSGIRWFCLEDKFQQWETLHAWSESVCLCLVLVYLGHIVTSLLKNTQSNWCKFVKRQHKVTWPYPWIAAKIIKSYIYLK